MGQTSGIPHTVKHFLVYCRELVETKKRLEMSDNLFEALSPIQE